MLWYTDNSYQRYQANNFICQTRVSSTYKTHQWGSDQKSCKNKNKVEEYWEPKIPKNVSNTAKVIYAWDKKIINISKYVYSCKQ